jgi:uncharacterized membrane protein (UPF0127 family)
MAASDVALVNMRTGVPIATSVERAMTRATRKRGLLGRDGMPSGSALMIEPCPAVHTAFMRFAIDIVFIDRQGYAIKIVRNLRAWRAAVAPRAYAVVEMPAGSLDQVDLAVGDRLFLSTDTSSVSEAEQAGRRRVVEATAG